MDKTITNHTQPADDLVKRIKAHQRGESCETTAIIKDCKARIERQAKHIEELEAYNATRTDELLAATRRISKLEGDVALAREALKAVQALIPRACKGGLVFAQEFAPVTEALSTLTTGNAVQQIEARAIRELAENVTLWFPRPASHLRYLARDAIRKLAEQKEKG